MRAKNNSFFVSVPKQRLVTFIILSLLMICFTLLTSDLIFKIILTLLLLLAAWEWTQLVGLEKMITRGFYLLLLLLTVMYLPSQVMPELLMVVAVFWLLLLWAIIAYPKSRIICSKQWLIGGLGLIILAAYWLAITQLRNQEQGKTLLLYLIVLVSAADVGAYLGGKFFGQHTLIVAVSPGKTWEGLFSGLLLAMIVSIIAGLFFSIAGRQWISWLLLALVTVLISIVGDLTESLLKRQQGLKDSGKLLPGHGGILDRIDSHLAAAPIFVLLLMSTTL